MKPLISIIIPTYNRAFLLGETLDSIINQTYSNWECIVVDDISSDATEVMLDSYCKKDVRIQFYSRPLHLPKGANVCRNYGFEKSRGTLIKWFDSDDLLVEDALEVQEKHLNDNPNIDVSIGFVDYFEENIKNSRKVRPEIIVSKDVIFDYVTEKLIFSTGGPLWRRSFLSKRKKLFNESLNRLQDTEFHYRMLLDGVRFQFIERTVEYYRNRAPGAITTNSSDENLDSVFRYWKYVLITAKCNNPGNNRILKLFVTNKLSLLYQRMILNHTSTNRRMKIAKKYFGNLMEVYKITGVPVKAYQNAILGSFLTILTGKGLKFFRIKME